MARSQLVFVHDAAVVWWEEGHRRPQLRQLRSLAGRGALSGAFWGMLFGMIFLVPVVGAAVGAAVGGAGGRWPTSASTTTSSNRSATS